MCLAVLDHINVSGRCRQTASWYRSRFPSGMAPMAGVATIRSQRPLINGWHKLGVPEEIWALGVGTEATTGAASIRKKNWRHQKRLERIIVTKHHRPDNEQTGAVRLRFGDISPEDELRGCRILAVLNAGIRPLASGHGRNSRLRLPVDEDDTGRSRDRRMGWRLR